MLLSLIFLAIIWQAQLSISKIPWHLVALQRQRIIPCAETQHEQTNIQWSKPSRQCHWAVAMKCYEYLWMVFSGLFITMNEPWATWDGTPFRGHAQLQRNLETTAAKTRIPRFLGSPRTKTGLLWSAPKDRRPWSLSKTTRVYALEAENSPVLTLDSARRVKKSSEFSRKLQRGFTASALVTSLSLRSGAFIIFFGGPLVTKVRLLMGISHVTQLHNSWRASE